MTLCCHRQSCVEHLRPAEETVQSVVQVEHFFEDDDSVPKKSAMVEREDSVISGLTTEGDEVPYSIKVSAVKTHSCAVTFHDHLVEA